jgi:hypothetical protein
MNRPSFRPTTTRGSVTARPLLLLILVVGLDCRRLRPETDPVPTAAAPEVTSDAGAAPTGHVWRWSSGEVAPVKRTTTVRERRDPDGSLVRTTTTVTETSAHAVIEIRH